MRRTLTLLALLAAGGCRAYDCNVVGRCPAGSACSADGYCLPIPGSGGSAGGSNGPSLTGGTSGGGSTGGGSTGVINPGSGDGGPGLVPISIGPGGSVADLGAFPDQDVTLLGQIAFRGNQSPGYAPPAGLFASVSGAPWIDLTPAVAASVGDAGTYVGSGIFFADPGPNGAWFAATLLLVGGQLYGGFGRSVDQGQSFGFVAPPVPINGRPALARASGPDGGTVLFIGTSESPAGLAELLVGSDAGYTAPAFWDAGVPASLAISPDGTLLYAITGAGATFLAVNLQTGQVVTSAPLPCVPPAATATMDVVPIPGGSRVFGAIGPNVWELTADGGPAPLLGFDPPPVGFGQGSLAHLGGFEYLAYGDEVSAFPLSAAPSGMLLDGGSCAIAGPQPLQTGLLSIQALAPRGPSMVAGTRTGVYDVTQAAILAGAFDTSPRLAPTEVDEGFDGVAASAFVPGDGHLFALGSDGRAFEALVPGAFAALPRPPAGFNLGFLSALAALGDGDLLGVQLDGTFWRWQGAGWTAILAPARSGGSVAAFSPADAGAEYAAILDAGMGADAGANVFVLADGGWQQVANLPGSIALLAASPPGGADPTLYAFDATGAIYQSHDGVSFTPLAASLQDKQAPGAASIDPTNGGRFAVLISHTRGIALFDGTSSSLTASCSALGAGQDAVEGLSYDPDGGLWVVGHEGLFQVDRSAVPPTCQLVSRPASQEPLLGIGIAPTGEIYAGGLSQSYEYR
ncbi:MAG: hypothetical protein ACYCWW_15865 [Deltaproteobacteria bacterium]